VYATTQRFLHKQDTTTYSPYTNDHYTTYEKTHQII
jgi:hypothetical protein